MVIVKARLEQPQQGLFDGMNVRVRVQRATDSQLLIPKTALVLTQQPQGGVYQQERGRAQWVYVQTAWKIQTSFVVTRA
jgi:hypothetical protein